MKLTLDASSRSVVVTCASCPPWRVLRADRRAAWLAAADHARNVHGANAVADTLTNRAMSKK